LTHFGAQGRVIIYIIPKYDIVPLKVLLTIKTEVLAMKNVGRKITFQTARLICFCASLFLLSSVSRAYAQDSDSSNDNVQEMRTLILQWSSSVHSFAGKYRLTLDKPDAGQSPAAVYEIEYRYQDKNRYFRKNPIIAFPSHPDDIMTYALYHDDAALRVESNTENAPKPATVSLHRKGWDIPWGVYITPEELFGEFQEVSLAEILSEGSSSILERSGQRIFSHINKKNQKNVDIYVDDQNRVSRIEWVMRLSNPEEEIRTLWKGDLFDVRRVIRAIEFGETQEINGVPFPVWAERTRWNVRDEDFDALKKELETGKITNLQFAVRLYTELEAFQIEKQVFELFPESVTINQPLAKDDFRVPVNEGDLVARSEVDEYYAPYKPWYKNPWHPAMIAVYVLITLIAASLGLWFIGRRLQA